MIRKLYDLPLRFLTSLRKRGLHGTLRHGSKRMIRKLYDLPLRFLTSLRKRGLRETLRRGSKRVIRRLKAQAADPYRDWLDDHRPRPSDLARQRRWASMSGDRPRFCLVISTEGGSRDALAWTMRSLGRQTYGHWDALYLDSVSEGTVRQALRETADDYVGFVRMGDTLSHEALYEFAMRVLEDPGHRPDVLYCDEDHLEADGRTRVRPIFKPAWSPEMLLGYDYMGRLTLVRRELMEHVGGIGPGIDEAAHWDLKLRLACRTDRIVRIPECLYHNRCDLDVRETYRAGPAGRDVLKAHLNRLGLDGVDAIEQPNGTFRVRWTLPDYPLVSIIIPTVDQPRLIRRCVAGLLSGTSYPKKEIILVDNGSTDPETLALYEGWKASGTVEVIPFDHPFNYSAACNVGAAAARGDYLLFFNNDIEISSSDWLEEMMRWAQLPGVGIVGPKMIFPDGRVNHAGIAVTRDSFANLYWGDAGDYWSIFGHVNSYRNYSGLLGACQLMSRSTFEGLGGYDERFLLVCSDIDLCLKARQSGFRLVYDPHAVLIHHESTTRRGIGDPIDDLNLASREIIRLGYLEDPYYHPSLAPCKTMPELRPSYEPSSSAYFGWLFSEKNPGILRDLDLDLYDEGSVRDIAGRWSSGCFPGDWSPVKVDSDAETAACFVLDLLRKDSALRRTFPRALAEGLEGAYCRWLCSEAVTRYGLPSSACDMIRNVFQSRPSARIRQIYELTDDLQRTYPRAYLRAGRARFFRWLLAEGRKQYGITNAAIWWFLIECDEDPAGELSRTYRISPVWQRFFPDAYTPVGRGRFARWLYDRHGIDATGFGDSGHPDLGPLEGLRLAYGCRGEWKRRFPGALRTASETRELAAWLRDREGSDPRVDAWLLQIEAEVDRGGLDRLEMNVLGHFCYPSGLQASTLAYLDSLKSAGVVTSCRDVPASLEHDEPDRDAYLGLEAYDVSLIHVQPEPYLPVAYDRARLASRRGVYRVAMWVCETDSIPEEWRSVSRLVNEVWTMSRFVAEGLRRLLLDVPVHHLTPGLRIGPIGRIRRDRYGIALDRFVFHFMFDMNSTLERKNPLGVIAAFKEAFRRDDKATLVIKVSRGRSNPDGMARLRRAADEVGAIIIDQVLPRDEVTGLLDACDCYISLHRCEGLGLTMAEAMLLGKPTIATAYSGNLDFMDTSNSLLVGYKLVEIEEDVYLYRKGHYWAEPSIAEAARAMRWVFENRDAACELGELARITAGEYFSPEAAGRRMAQRLAQIRRERFGIGCDEESSLIQA